MRRFAVLLFATVVVTVAGCSQRPRGAASDPTAPAGSDLVASELPVEVGPSDTWASVSERIFGDASRAERIATDNGASLGEDPIPGTRVVVRILDDEVDRVRRMNEARGPYNNGVEAMQEQGGLERARTAFERALAAAPFFVDARYNLGLVLIQLEQPQLARENLAEVVRARPGDKDARYALGAAYVHAGDFARAVPELEAALAIDPGFLRALWTHALALQRVGRVEEARRQWEAYLERDSQSNWAAQARRHLAELGS